MNLLRILSIVLAGFFIFGVLCGCSNKNATKEQTTAIINARIFDGENLITETIVIIKDGYIQAVGGDIPADAIIIDAGGATLMPGLIDSHAHTNMNGLKDALKFGVTTELAMNGTWSKRQRNNVSKRNDVADVRAPGMGVVPPGGHPSQYLAESSNLLLRWFFSFPFVSTPEEARTHVTKQIAGGADYIKIFIEDGTVIGYPNMPIPREETIQAAVSEAHKHEKIALFHATTYASAEQAIRAGADGLVHIFIDIPHTPEIINSIANSGAFVVPTLALSYSAIGNSGVSLASDERVSSRLSKDWLAALSRSTNTFPQGNLDTIFASVMALHEAGVDILAGSDVTAEPLSGLGGLAHGVSLHHELQLLVSAGFTPIEALRAATSVPARRFALTDRGRVFPGARADLLLVDGDPLTNISDTLSIRDVWRRGVRLAHN